MYQVEYLSTEMMGETGAGFQQAAGGDSSPVAWVPPKRICLFLLVWPQLSSLTPFPSQRCPHLRPRVPSKDPGPIHSEETHPSGAFFLTASSRSLFHAKQPQTALESGAACVRDHQVIDKKQQHFCLFISISDSVCGHLVKRSSFIGACLLQRFLMAWLKTTTVIIVFPAPNNRRKSQHPFDWKMAFMRLLRCLPQDAAE